MLNYWICGAESFLYLLLKYHEESFTYPTLSFCSFFTCSLESQLNGNQPMHSVVKALGFSRQTCWNTDSCFCFCQLINKTFIYDGKQSNYSLLAFLNAWSLPFTANTMKILQSTPSLGYKNAFLYGLNWNRWNFELYCRCIFLDLCALVLNLLWDLCGCVSHAAVFEWHTVLPLTYSDIMKHKKEALREFLYLQAGFWLSLKQSQIAGGLGFPMNIYLIIVSLGQS